MGRPAFEIKGMPPAIDDDPTELPELMSLAEAAKMLKCSAKHLRDNAASGKLAHYRIGRGYHVAKCDLIKWARSRRVSIDA